MQWEEAEAPVLNRRREIGDESVLLLARETAA
jgi:hypothetical protein